MMDIADSKADHWNTSALNELRRKNEGAGSLVSATCGSERERVCLELQYSSFVEM